MSAAEHLQPKQHDPRQLQLLINPTEHIERMRNSTDAGGLRTPSPYGYDSSTDYSVQPTGKRAMDLPNPAPNEKMKRTWAWKEDEAREPSGSGTHGAGMYDIIASGEQIREPIHINIMDDPADDVQYEGHHRVAAGHAVERDTGQRGSVWLPVRYNDYRRAPAQPNWGVDRLPTRRSKSRAKSRSVS